MGLQNFVSKRLPAISAIWLNLIDAYVIGSGTKAPNERTAEEIVAGVTPVNFAYPPGDARRFAKLDGVTDDTIALNNWAAVQGYHFFPAQTALISGQIVLTSNCTFVCSRNGSILSNTQNMKFFYATAQSRIDITGFHFKLTSAGTAAYASGIYLLSCTDCKVQDSEFEGMQWSGVTLDRSSRNFVSRNYFHDFLSPLSLQDANDITVYGDASFNIIEDNWCFGGAGIGILVQDPYAGFLPLKNLVKGNRVGAHTQVGITVYVPTAGDTYNTIESNFVEGITGAWDTLLYGTGIYVVGAGAGGTTIKGNTVRNCCTATTGTTNGPAGITISGLAVVNAPCKVVDNLVDGMTKYHGILAVANLGGLVEISNNQVRHPASNVTGAPICVERSPNTTVATNQIQVAAGSSSRGILIYANNAGVMGNVTVSLNTVVGGGDRQIEFLVSGTGSFLSVTVNGNICSGAAAGVIPIYLSTIAGGTISNNVTNATTTYPMFVSACTGLRLSNNSLVTTGTIGFGSGNTCTGSYFDKTNTAGGFIENSGTGMICEQLLNAAPASASSVARIGDRVEQSVPVVGNPKGWRCTVAGNPGTWVSEGNL